MVQRHIVVIPNEDGGVQVHPLKEWLRQHPDENPTGIDPSSSTSHQLRNAMRRAGWTMQETPSEVRLIKPGQAATSELVQEILGSGEADDERPEMGFSLERQLQEFLASNLSAISVNGQRLSVYADAAGRDGIEYPSAVGPMDILAVDEKGALYVFELKRANSADKAIGQVARYMGWVRQTIGKDHDVFGVIVAKTISENLRYAASVVAGVFLFEYEVEFHLRPAHEIGTSG